MLVLPTMTTGVVIALAAVALALGVGLWRAVTDGRFGGSSDSRRWSSSEHVETPAPAAELVRSLGAELGERATLLQFSSAFCAPCRATRQVLSGIAGDDEAIVHVEVDAEEHLEATRAFGILRTPTTLVLDAAGREVARATGAPRKEQVLTALASVDR